jgi:gliding motility-associated-like protein
MRKNSPFLFSLCCLSFLGLTARETPVKHLWTSKEAFEEKAFIENKGQYDLKEKGGPKDILFGARLNGLQYFFTNDGIWILRNEPVKRTEREIEELKEKFNFREAGKKEKEETEFTYKFVEKFHRMQFVGAGAVTTVLPETQVSRMYNFSSKNNDSYSAHAYKKITYINLYPGIDAEFIFPEGKEGFKYNLIVHRGADASQVKIQYPLSEKTKIDLTGNLIIRSAFGNFTDHAPVANLKGYQTTVACSFVLTGETVSFKLANYDVSKDLIIDPWTQTPVFAGANNAYDVDWDNAGNCYAYGGLSPYMITKFSPAGVPLWTFTTTAFLAQGTLSGTYYGDFAVNRISQSIFITDGGNLSSGAGVIKLNQAGTQVAIFNGNPTFQEMWRISYSRCTGQCVITGGGTTVPTFNGCYLDTNLVGLNPLNVNNTTAGYNDMWGLTLDAFGSAYFVCTQNGATVFTNDICKVPMPALTPITWQATTTYSLTEVSSVMYYPFGATSNGFNGITMSSANLYLYDTYVLSKWNSATGAMITSSSISGTSQSTVSYGGLSADDCDHLFLGTSSNILIYDGNTLSQIGTIPAAGSVNDVSFANNSILYSCGVGFVSSSNVTLPSCSILSPTLAVTNASCTNPVGSATISIGGGTLPYSIAWSTTPVQTGSVVANLPAGTYTATITDNSCPPLNATYTFSIVQTNGVSVSSSITNVKCKGGNDGSISITNTGTTTPTYTWSTGSNASSVSNLAPGTYTLVVGSSTGCNMTLLLNVTEPPAITATVTPGILKCFGDTTSISVAVSGGTPAVLSPNYVVNWNPPAATGLSVHGLGIGNYGATVVDSLGCTATFTIGLTQPPPLVPNFTLTPACFGSPVQFTDLSTGGPFISWDWNYGDGSASGTSQNPAYTYSVSGTYIVTLTPKTVNSCTATATETLTVFPGPVVYFKGDTIAGCPEHSVNFKDSSVTIAGTIVKWDWNFGNGTVYNGQFPPTVTYTNSSNTVPLTYNVSLFVTSNNGCMNSLIKNKYITVYPKPKAGFTYNSDDGSQIDVLNNKVHFYSQALGATIYNYNFGDLFADPANTDLSVLINPIHQYLHDDPYTYYVTQVVENQYACKDSVTKPLIIHPVCTFFIPNSFSPNSDGTNDFFKGTGIGIDNSTYIFMIFDRWGNSVFKTNDVEKAWDGRINGKGDTVQEDVYVWKVKFKDTIGKSHEYNGIVSILK